MDYEANHRVAELKHEAASSRDSGIRLGDQLEETSRLVDQLHEQVSVFEKLFAPVLREEDEARGEVTVDPTPSLSPYQRHLMGIYNSLNMLGNRMSDIQRRVQL
jgi:hypothetical protein